MNQYDEKSIQKIKEKLTLFHAKDFVTPILMIFLSLGFVVLSLLFIQISKSTLEWGLGIFLLSLSLLRLFMIFHDLCHKNYFPSDERETKTRKNNFQMAEMLEFLNLYSADGWEQGHSSHHKAHGNLNLNDGSRLVLSDDEYNKLPLYQQWLYSIFRFPLLFFFIAPIYIFWIRRFVDGDWVYLLKYGLFLFLLFCIGKRLGLSFLLAQYLTGIIGLSLFHLQHQVNIGYLHPFDLNDHVSKANAELLGASVLTIPFFFNVFTNGIEYHNIHHIDPGVPSYNIRHAYEQLVKDGDIPDKKIGYSQAFFSLFHTKYNNKTGLYY